MGSEGPAGLNISMPAICRWQPFGATVVAETLLLWLLLLMIIINLVRVSIGLMTGIIMPATAKVDDLGVLVMTMLAIWRQHG